MPKGKGPPPAHGYPRLKPKVYRLLISGVRIQIDIEQLLGAQIDIAGHVDIAAKSRGMPNPGRGHDRPGGPDSFSSSGSPMRKPWELKRSAEGP